MGKLRRFFLCAAALCLQLSALPAAQAADARRFNFAWPAPAEVEVKARIEKKGAVAITTYTARLEPDGENGYLLTLNDIELVSLNGTPADDPALAPQLGMVKAMSQLVPVMQVDKDGRYRGPRDLEKTIDKVIAMMPADMDASTRDQLRALFMSPQMQAQLQQSSGDLWNSWVGAWTGLDIAPGQPMQTSVPIETLGGTLTQNIQAEHRGASGQFPCCVELAMVTEMQGPELLQLMSNEVNELAAAAAASAGPDNVPTFENVTVTSVGRVITDPATLKPRYAALNKIIAVSAEGQPPATRTDKSEFWFSWP